MVDVIMTGIVARYVLSGHVNIRKQAKHVAMIMSSVRLDPLVTDYYYEPAEPLLKQHLCGQMHNLIMSTNKFIPRNGFSRNELNVINFTYMLRIYLPENFPLTYRNETYVDIDNKMANHIYENICISSEKRAYSMEQPPSLVATAMLLVFGMQIRGLLFYM